MTSQRPEPTQNGASAATPARPPPTTHKRTYQACIPCRQRKVRCDLGSVEAPHDPPCVRCRRESKECFFSATRRKRTPSGDIPPGLGRGRGVRKFSADLEMPDFKRSRTSETPFRSPSYTSQPSPGYPPAGFGQAIDPQLSMPAQHPPARHGAANAATTADTLLQTEVYNSHEALLTLIEAAGKDTPLMKSESRSSRQEDDDDQEEAHPESRTEESSRTSDAPPRRPNGVRFNSTSKYSDRGSNRGSTTRSHPYRKMSMVSPSNMDDGIEKALMAWNKFRFVQAGWFTAREAISFVEYFSQHLHPLSPTLTHPTLLHISHPRYHHLLLRHEPFLATAILTVASRYLRLSGPGGKMRSNAIHDMLWREVRNAFERIVWGGGWGGIGIVKSHNSHPNPNTGATTGRGLRTLGTVEALIIMTEWHVRGIHFPMDVEEGDWGIELSDDEDEPRTKTPLKGGIALEGLGDRLDNILEPAARSDRMSWMLLGNALTLAYELGVFDETEGNVTPAPTPPAAAEPANPFRLRAKRIQKLLLVYIMQLASRLGWTSMIPRSVRDSIEAHHTPLPNPPLGIPPNWSNPDELQDAVFSIWVNLTMFMENTARTLFSNRTETKMFMRTGRYVGLIEQFRPKLESWKHEFESLQLPPPIHQILVLEYEHVRFYVNSLALQAVIDRFLVNPPTPTNPRPFSSIMNPKDLEFITEVVDSCRSVLHTVVTKMYPAGYLQHAPIRVYSRILSAAMFLLKTFALGAKEVEVKESMLLIERTCDALRDAAVDDLHLGLRYADILGGIAGRVKQKFVKYPHDDDPEHAHHDAENHKAAAATPGYSGQTNGTYDGAVQGAQGNQGDGAMGTGDMGYWWGNEDWLALPLDPIMGYDGVTQGTMGVDVGGVDLLEALLAQPADE